mmetsp:Transcript_16299/g.41232  ORF Transcript_16299/g.41232 Transcript_16299/m.41232 type:complete len:252 (+) Transcript_16299:250-1005(+)
MGRGDRPRGERNGRAPGQGPGPGWALLPQLHGHGHDPGAWRQACAPLARGRGQDPRPRDPDAVPGAVRHRQHQRLFQLVGRCGFPGERRLLLLPGAGGNLDARPKLLPGRHCRDGDAQAGLQDAHPQADVARGAQRGGGRGGRRQRHGHGDGHRAGHEVEDRGARRAWGAHDALAAPGPHPLGRLGALLRGGGGPERGAPGARQGRVPGGQERGMAQENGHDPVDHRPGQGAELHAVAGRLQLRALPRLQV